MATIDNMHKDPEARGLLGNQFKFVPKERPGETLHYLMGQYWYTQLESGVISHLAKWYDDAVTKRADALIAQILSDWKKQ